MPLYDCGAVGKICGYVIKLFLSIKRFSNSPQPHEMSRWLSLTLVRCVVRWLIVQKYKLEALNLERDTYVGDRFEFYLFIFRHIMNSLSCSIGGDRSVLTVLDVAQEHGGRIRT